MDFLKSAVASAIAKGPAFPYSFGDRVDLDPSIWTLYNGTRREDGSNCSIFSFDVTANKSRLPLARNALKKLRTLRHPGVIKVLETVETDTYIYIATERVVPLRWHVKRKSLSPETLKWGLHNVARTIKFINDDAASVHGSLKVASIFTSESGEWKLGGFEVLSNVKDDDAVIYHYGSAVPDAARYTPPELARDGWDALKRSNHWAVDSYNYGLLVLEVFGGDVAGGDVAGQAKSVVPPTMQTGFKRLVNANPKVRISVANFVDMGQRAGGFFDSPLIKLTDGIENLGMLGEEERARFLDDLDGLDGPDGLATDDDVRAAFFTMKVLPELLKSVEFGGGGPKAFGLVMTIAAALSGDDFDARVAPVVLRLFANPDRALRVCLLDNLPRMIDRFTTRVVSDKIFPHVVSGFTDVAPIVREQTLKSVLVFVPKLSDRIINGELLRHLAKTANDEQPGIRTNTTICLGKIAKSLGTSSRAKVLIAAFTRALRDPFVHARNAALLALAATADVFTPDDVAARILPAVCAVLLDKEKLVRDQATKTMDVFMQRIRKAAAAMADTALPPSSPAGNGVPRMGTPQTDASASSAAGSWAGWAISSFTKLSVAAGEIESGAGNGNGNGNGNGAAIPRPASTTDMARPGPAAATTTTTTTTTASASSLHRQALRSPPASRPLSRAPSSNSQTANAFLGDDAWGGDDAAADDAWGAMDDGFGDADADADGDAWDTPGDENTEPSAAKSTKAAASGRSVSGSAQPFGGDDDGEPDFAGWLAAQEAKKKKTVVGGGKTLPKGLTKTGSSTAASTTTKRPTPKPVAKPAAKPAEKPAKKIDLAPKDDGDEDGWGDGW